MKTFNDLVIPKWLQDSLMKIGYKEPTPIQEQTIPLILEGKDILGTAQTGTGKTGAFLIPLLAYLYNNKNAKALILTPTRELAIQVHNVALQMIKGTAFFKSAILIGGESMPKQFQQLRANPRLIVGTPGRINDHLNRNTLKLDKASFVVLDETDRMLDMGFGVQIDAIFEHMPKAKQVLLFSATMPKEILRLVDNYLTSPEKISVGEINQIAKNVTQEVICTSDKYKELLNYLRENTGTSIIFVKTQRMTETLFKKLKQEDLKVDILHGGLKQNKRAYITKAFRNKKFNILVATDVASRGLDIPHIENVINYDITQNPEDYVHRIGRTARAEKNGKSITLIMNSEKGEWNRIQKFIGKEDLLFSDVAKSSAKKGRNSSNSRNSTSRGNNSFYGKSNDRKSSDRRPSDRRPSDRKSGDNNGNRKYLFTEKKENKKSFDPLKTEGINLNTTFGNYQDDKRPNNKNYGRKNTIDYNGFIGSDSALVRENSKEQKGIFKAKVRPEKKGKFLKKSF